VLKKYIWLVGPDQDYQHRRHGHPVNLTNVFCPPRRQRRGHRGQGMLGRHVSSRPEYSGMTPEAETKPEARLTQPFPRAHGVRMCYASIIALAVPRSSQAKKNIRNIRTKNSYSASHQSGCALQPRLMWLTSLAMSAVMYTGHLLVAFRP
jgi:hypothetical protein